ncbi:class I SAM-dependent methyltransferase [Flavobacterium sp. Root420]|uniref:class I SAM-dependent methyltransferase n=1 Tax=Flavobacterium sp. Root420 TaxID=1736533 RepID=UPI0006F97C04|nr:class I SAM-dependent methyltransferase [Flavobacterium sp. Root420]KQW97874.1 SAM-dependent methyltransferase [Flavobacterium sp. Root420]
MNKIINQVSEYYTSKIKKHGTTAQGVDWNSPESQELRFEVLSNLIQEQEHFSILDFGCGFGSMFDYFNLKYSSFEYIGFDVAEEMIVAALNKFPTQENAKWTSSLPIKKTDYVIASGIFNVKLENTNEDWLTYILETLEKIDAISVKGFSFNILTKYSDIEYMKEYLYYADPSLLFDYCKTNFSKNVALLHDYNLYEFSIIVRK